MSEMMDLTYFGGSFNDASFRKMQDSRWRMIYPAPFFDPIAMQTIMDPKLLIQWSRFFYDWHPIIRAAINGMVTYPITDFIFDTEDPLIRKNYEQAFNTLKVREMLHHIGLDYYISGASYLSIIMPFKRMLTCQKCGYSSDVKSAKPRIIMQKVHMTCPKCGEDTLPKVIDSLSMDLSEMHKVHWNPLNMTIDYDEVLDTYDFFYSLPNYAKQKIQKGSAKYLEKYPMYFIDAVNRKTQIKIKNSEMLHIQSPSHSASYVKGWGQPLITPCLKYLFHLLVLIRGQDALAIDQILPWTVMSPAANAGVDPANDMDLGNWKDQVQEEYNAWKKNPLHKSIMPVPLTAQMIGGQGKSLMLNPEIDAITNQILAGMGVPNEFVFGGLQWSGASVSLRMLENKFINYRTMMQDAIDWIVSKIHLYFGYPTIKVRMQPFKMADDAAQKQMLLDLAGNKIISYSTALNDILPDLDYANEQEKIKKEQTAIVKLNQEIQRASEVAGISVGPTQTMADPSGGASGGAAPSPLPEQNPPRSEGTKKQI